MPRRDFLERLALLAGGTAAANMILPLLENNYAHADTVAEDDPRLRTEFPAIAEKMGGYIAYPLEGPRMPGVIVIQNQPQSAYPRCAPAGAGKPSPMPRLSLCLGGAGRCRQARNMIGCRSGRHPRRLAHSLKAIAKHQLDRQMGPWASAGAAASQCAGRRQPAWPQASSIKPAAADVPK
jgi:hypothetical protein